MNRHDQIISFMCTTDSVFFKSKKYIVQRYCKLMYNIDKFDDPDIPIEVLIKYLPKEEPIKFTTEENVYDYVIKELLQFKQLPYLVLLQLTLEAINDLKDINDEIDKLDQLKRDNAGIYKFYEIEYYKKINLEEKNHIINFLTTGIKEYALNKSFIHSETIFYPKFLNTQYPYAKSGLFNTRESCKIELFSVFFNKFLGANYNDIEKFISILENDNSKLIDIGRKYIIEQDCNSTLFDMSENNYILSKRGVILQKIIEYYKSNDYIALVNIIPMQVEGIFHDICVAIGFDENNLNKKSLYEKLLILKEERQIYTLYNYFSHHFQKIRNEVAHGYVYNNNRYEYLAIYLYLDLLSVCSITNNKSIPLNHSLQIISTFEHIGYEMLIEWVDFIDLEHPDFNGILVKYKNALSKYSENDFWKYLNTNIDNDKYSFDYVQYLINQITKLKKQKIEKQNCKLILEKLGRYSV